jgi:hypothetical protein
VTLTGTGSSNPPRSAILESKPGRSGTRLESGVYRKVSGQTPVLSATSNRKSGLYNRLHRRFMFIIHVAVILIVIGLLLWLATTYIPMADPIKKILVAVVVIGTVLWLLSVFGIFDLGSFGDHPVHRYN